VRQAQLPKLEEIKDQIAQQMKQQKVAAFQASLREKAKVE
jgi:peptidyl-prolyl cis-trans isomerase C